MRKGLKMSIESREKLSALHKARYENGKAIRKIFSKQKNNRWKVHCRDGKTEFWYHIVYMNFLNGEEISKGFCIHHKDGNPENDDLENLEMLTRAEHSYLHSKGKKLSIEHKNKIGKTHTGMIRSEKCKQNISRAKTGKERVNYRGELCSNVKLTEKKVIEIRKLSREQFSLKKIAELYKISRSAAAAIRSRRSWKHI